MTSSSPAVLDGKAIYARYTPQAWVGNRGDNLIDVHHYNPDDLEWVVAADTWHDITGDDRAAIEQQLRDFAPGDRWDEPGGGWWADQAADAPEASAWVRGRNGYGPFEVHFFLGDLPTTTTTTPSTGPETATHETIADGHVVYTGPLPVPMDTARAWFRASVTSATITFPTGLDEVIWCAEMDEFNELMDARIGNAVSLMDLNYAVDRVVTLQVWSPGDTDDDGFAVAVTGELNWELSGITESLTDDDDATREAALTN